MFKKLGLAFLLIGLFSLKAEAACDSGSSPSWTTAISTLGSCITTALAAGSGGVAQTIHVSAGAATVTSNFAFTVANSDLTIIGPTCDLPVDEAQTMPFTIPYCGASSASITFDHAPGTVLFDVTNCSTHIFRLAHMTLRYQQGWASIGMVEPSCSTPTGVVPINFRVDHVQFDGDPRDGSSSGGRWLFARADYGLLDHNQFIGQTSRAATNISWGTDSALSTDYAYHHPFAMGDANCGYVEDNLFYSSVGYQGNGATDNYQSCYVFRHNVVKNNNIGHHGLDSQNRGVWRAEDYLNTYVAESGADSIQRFQPRSGTVISWGNVVKNMAGAANGYIAFMEPQCYACQGGGQLAAGTGLWYNQRAILSLYYPNSPWSAYNGMKHDTIAVADSYAGYSQASEVDGNIYGVDSMDASYTTTVTDMTTTAGSASISTGTDIFVSGAATTIGTSMSAYVVAQNFKRGRLSSCATNGTTTITCASETFSDGDVGRHVSFDSRDQFAGGLAVTTIASVCPGSDCTKAVLVVAPSGSTTETAIFSEPVIIAVADSKHATMSVHATASGSNKTLSVGYTNQGYPLLDQIGRGYFASANAGSWPTQASYTEANYEKLMPYYIIANQWTATNGSLVFSSCTNSPSCKPPATQVTYASTAAYFKSGRDFFDQVGGIQTSSSSPFDGTTGSGFGTLARKPGSCTPPATGDLGVGYWAANDGNWNHSSVTYIPDHGDGTSFSQGQLYVCDHTGAFQLYYTPYTYPHPLNTDAGAVTTPTAKPSRDLRRLQIASLNGISLLLLGLIGYKRLCES